MGELLPRHLETELEQALISAKVVNIVGPRQVGKTTLVRDLLKTGNFITLDDENVLAALEADPKGQLDALI
ncbi:AAA family ATPase, partial [Rhizobium leguminosarum]